MTRIPAAVAAMLAAWSLALPAAHADAVTTMERFFDEVRTFRADFDQVVLDESLNRIEESSGKMWIARPDRFRWNYEAPLEQEIVGDGERVWVYDVELEQVTVRPMQAALGQTPAALLAGRGDLEDNFTVNDLGRQGQLDTVELEPVSAESGYESMRIGFEGTELRLLELDDRLGQTTRITFRNVRENVEVAPERFLFEPPAGVDVIDETRG